MTAAPEPQSTRVDRWEIRCRFNRARYRERMKSGEFAFVLSKRNPIVQKPNDPDPLPANYRFTCEWYYKDVQSGAKVADGHYYELDDGTTTDHDPKHLR